MYRNIFFVRIGFAVILTALSSFCIGCQKLPPKPENLPELHPCRISVTFGGETIEGVGIGLKSVDPNTKWRASGRTDKKGVAVMNTSAVYPGTPVGQYVVSFSKVEDKDGATDPTMSIAEMGGESAIPLKYTEGQSTETVEVKPGRNSFSFELDGGAEPVQQSDKKTK